MSSLQIIVGLSIGAFAIQIAHGGNFAIACMLGAIGGILFGNGVGDKVKSR